MWTLFMAVAAEIYMVKLTSRLNPEAHKEKQPEKSILVSQNESNLIEFLTEVGFFTEFTEWNQQFIYRS